MIIFPLPLASCFVRNIAFYYFWKRCFRECQLWELDLLKVLQRHILKKNSFLQSTLSPQIMTEKDKRLHKIGDSIKTAILHCSMRNCYSYMAPMPFQVLLTSKLISWDAENVILMFRISMCVCTFLYMCICIFLSQIHKNQKLKWKGLQPQATWQAQITSFGFTKEKIHMAKM